MEEILKEILSELQVMNAHLEKISKAIVEDDVDLLDLEARSKDS